MEIPTETELYELCKRVKERFISRMRSSYGETDEFEQWADSMDMLDRAPQSQQAQELSRAALQQLIRTKDPQWQKP